MNVHPISNTDKQYSCVFCGNGNVSVIRESEDPRLKCNVCNGTFDASQSSALQHNSAENTIRESSAEELAGAQDAEQVEYFPSLSPDTKLVPQQQLNIPRIPKYVFVSKNRKRHEFSSEKDIKKKVFKWEQLDVKFDLYELVPKKSIVKLDIN